MSKLTRKTHTGSIVVGSSYWGERLHFSGLRGGERLKSVLQIRQMEVLSMGKNTHQFLQDIYHHPVAVVVFLRGATQQT